ncbi:S8 family peptidase [Dyadobacter sp. CY356]|uniref:S8 family peptidase n=1 Tax=Dyadobacter sp. CY356 TaxID=2906442 RepID=UPI001F1C7709|nr:S8 family peptidase [Dyadobacter sp. CY356]MCF0058461.1 S8 family peptidase [Dyadobacter sp. CY356]
MSDFPHLPLSRKIFGEYKFPSGGSNKKGALTLQNLVNRPAHAVSLTTSISSLRKRWVTQRTERENKGLPELPFEDKIPVFLQIDTESFPIESLKHWGIELLSEEQNGYVIGVSTDDFSSLSEKIAAFIASQGRYKDTAAKLWSINDGVTWRIQNILTPELSANWDRLGDRDMFFVYAGIACYLSAPAYPDKKDLTDEQYSVKIEKWHQADRLIREQRDDKAFERQDQFDVLLGNYGATDISAYIDFNDSFYISFKINGLGLKDLTLNYPYLFELGLNSSQNDFFGDDGEVLEITTQLAAPDLNAPKICVIDSGIQENHKLLNPAILSGLSLSFVPNDTDVADKVSSGGHGTKVAGAILYANNIPKSGNHQLPFWLVNARVLNDQNLIPDGVDPANLMINVVQQFDECKIFNLSIAQENAFSGTHMPAWAATIDKLTHEKEKLFIIAAGNIARSSSKAGSPGIREYIDNGHEYPNFLTQVSSKVANPSISSFSLTVGSVCHNNYEDDDKQSFGKLNDPSSFSRSGLGIWDMIKPDVVEYGGDFAVEKLGSKLLSNEQSISPELICSTLNSNSAISKHSVGTSFSAPKVTHIAGWLNKKFPLLSPISYKALIVQSARLPEEKWRDPSVIDMQMLGYGIPSLNRASENSESRITFLSEGKVSPKSADVYVINVPKEINRPGLDSEILVEITLSYTSKIRRTRKYLKSYLSSWLGWEISTFNENYEVFSKRVLKMFSDPKPNGGGTDNIPWTIYDRSNRGQIRDIKRQDNTTQKDWCMIPSNKLPKEFCIAVVGHNGWQKGLKDIIPYSIVVSFEVIGSQLPIYETFEIANRVTIQPESRFEVQIQD